MASNVQQADFDGSEIEKIFSTSLSKNEADELRNVCLRHGLTSDHPVLLVIAEMVLFRRQLRAEIDQARQPVTELARLVAQLSRQIQTQNETAQENRQNAKLATKPPVISSLLLALSVAQIILSVAIIAHEGFAPKLFFSTDLWSKAWYVTLLLEMAIIFSLLLRKVPIRKNRPKLIRLR